ncbi:MAG: hypothetical protein ACLTYB_16930, partial [Clostridium paraputrificum]
SELYGESSYPDRVVSIGVEFEYFNDLRREKLNLLYDEVVMWLRSSINEKLEIDFQYGYFVGRAQEISSLEVFEMTGRIEIKFICYQFIYGQYEEGNDIWDTFNFINGISQNTDFSINGIKEILLINPSIASIVPEVETTSDIEVIKGESVYLFKPGVNKDYRFMLNKGENRLTLKGKGEIRFKFRREVL